LDLGAQIRALQDDIVKLSAEREALIRKLRKAGWSHGRIAEATGLSRGRIAQIVA
jgi:DNA-directed RNA polymerase specialized sigma24 family protein